ncbi:hypothetical protein BC826DRAFT_1176909 [Russula brevipes]|nr:hypothetical protein BC826DRAFT_1176909 [Russula brevipes]
MSHTRPATTSSSNFQLVINNALKEYEKRTKNDLLAHPLAAQLQACDSPTSILAVLQQQVQEHNQSRTHHENLTGWLNPIVNVLYAFSATLGEGVGLVFPPAKAIFAGVGILLSAARDVRASQDTLVDIFGRIEGYFRRLEIYTTVSPTAEMMDIIVKIMVEVLCILGIATKEIKQGRAKKYVKKLTGRTDLEDALKKLDKLTLEEARMATVEVLKATHAVDDRVAGVTDMVAVVGERVVGIDDKVAGVGDGMAGVDGRVKTVETRIATVDDRVRAVDDKVAVVINGMENHLQLVVNYMINPDAARRKGDNIPAGNQLRENLRRWLSPSDPSTNHNIACGTHHDGTASWFFQGSVFDRWKSTGSLLWIHGKPGSGKSILCSTIIEDIAIMCRAGQASMCYFYFDFRDSNKQRWSDLVPSLLTQLSAHSAPRCDLLSRLYTNHDSGGQQPSDGVLAQCLKEMLTLPDERPIYLIMDALDECPTISSIPSPRERVLQFVKELVNLQLPNLHICVTSRPEIDIRDVLEPLTSSLVSLHDQCGQKDDIVAYIRSVVYSDSEPIMRRWKRRDKDCVIETLSERADGMFRWVFCQLEMLRHCLPSSVRRTLDELPESLDETYSRVLKEIKKPNRDHALRVLHCLVVAIRPLRVEELAEVLAVEFDNAEGVPKFKPDWRWDDEEQALLTSCSSLIAIVGAQNSRVVQFSHFSVKEFLTSPRLATSNGEVSRYYIDLESAHMILAQACLSILLPSAECAEDDEDKRIERGFPLVRYAAEHWVSHAQFRGVSTHLRKAMECLFDLDQPHFSAWLQLHDIDTYPSTDSTLFWFAALSKPAAPPLYYAALCGFLELAKHLIVKYPRHVNARGGRYTYFFRMVEKWISGADLSGHH